MADSEMPYRVLGGTGEKVSAIGIGGWHLALPKVDEKLAFRIVRSAIDRGINFMDNCWDYNDGASELRMGKALRDGYRQKVFLMTKIDGRIEEGGACGNWSESLERLQTDCIDLVQHHEILRFEDPHRIFDRGRRASGAARGRSRPASCATSASPGTRTRASTCTCWRSRASTASRSTRCRCR